MKTKKVPKNLKKDKFVLRLDFRKVAKIIKEFTLSGVDWGMTMVSFISSMFWCWLCFGFIKFSMIYLFGLAGAMTGDYTSSIGFITEYGDTINALAMGFGIMIMLHKVRFYYKTEIKE